MAADAGGASFVPTVSNQYMAGKKLPGQEVIEAMREQKVYIGRM